MAAPPPVHPTDAGFPLPSPLREDLADGLRAVNSNLHSVARAVRTHFPAHALVERAIVDAWSNLAAIERAAGVEVGVNKAAGMRRFLVVDDSPDMRFLVTRVLQKIAPRATILTAHDAPQALALLRDAGEGEGLAVISDHDLGSGPTGAQLLATIASRHPACHRILFTGYPAEFFEGQAIEAHALLPKGGPEVLRRYFGAP